MKSAPASTPSIASRMRGKNGSYCAFTSTSGIGRTARKSRGPDAAIDPERQQNEDYDHNGVFHVAEIVMEALIAPPRGPADPGECERPDRGTDRREDRVPNEGRLEDPCGDGDERADDGGHAPDQDGEVVPAV